MLLLISMLYLKHALFGERAEPRPVGGRVQWPAMAQVCRVCCAARGDGSGSQMGGNVGVGGLSGWQGVPSCGCRLGARSASGLSEGSRVAWLDRSRVVRRALKIGRASCRE